MENAVNMLTRSENPLFDTSFIPDDVWLELEDDQVQVLMAAVDNDNPTYEETLSGPYVEKWNEAKQVELTNLQRLNTWEVSKLPHGRTPIGYKWAFKIKREKGVIVKFKARLTAKGCSQKAGIDYTETFAPVARQTSLRLFLSLASALGVHIKQAEVANAFPNAPLQEEIYMKAPPELGLDDGWVLKLLQALYGLKQAGREWNRMLVDFLKSLGFNQSKIDTCIFFRGSRTDGNLHYILIYMDDLLLAAIQLGIIEEIIGQFRKNFTLTVEELGHFLGMDIYYNQSSGIMELSLFHYIQSLLNKYAAYLPHANKRRKNPMDQDGQRLSSAMRKVKCHCCHIVILLVH